MDWRALEVTYGEGATSWGTVMRPALVMQFFGQGDLLATRGGDLFDALLDLTQLRTQNLHVFGRRARSYRKLGPKGLANISTSLRNLPAEGQFYCLKNAPGFDCGDTALELELGSEHATINDIVTVALPLGFGDQERVERTVAAFQALVAEFPFWGAVAGWGFNLSWSRECEQATSATMLGAALRFPGLLVRTRAHESYAVKRLISAGWLTFIDAALCREVDVATVPATVQIREVRGGLLLRAGPLPPIGGGVEPGIEGLAELQRALSPVRLQRCRFSLPMVPIEALEAWLHRFD